LTTTTASFPLVAAQPVVFRASNHLGSGLGFHQGAWDLLDSEVQQLCRLSM